MIDPVLANCRVVRVLRQQPQAAWRCLGFPPAGAGPMFFQPWREVLPNIFQLEAINLPGRELRLNEAVPDRIDALVAEIVVVLTASFRQDPRPVLMFGHSFGGLVAFEVIRLLNQQGYRHPIALCVSAHCGPMYRTPVGALHRLDDQALIEELQRFDGVPAKLRSNEEYLAFCLPAIRADLRLDYQASLRMDCCLHQPLLVMAGNDDYVAPPELMYGWLNMTSGKSRFISWSGQHFYLRGQLPTLIDRLTDFAREQWLLPSSELSQKTI